jgi:NAD(P)-dependent dehydrogenase (short-subunit alcohol dehydrogenase family)
VSRHGKLDVMFNNAGISGSLAHVPLGSLDLADFDRVMAVNTRAMVAGAKHAARVMVPRRRGSIICTASTAGVMGSVAFPPYSVSKAAVLGLVRAVAGEMARSGVRVNAISPNYLPTPLVMGYMAVCYPGVSVDEHRRIVERDMNEMDGPALAGRGRRRRRTVPRVRRGQVRQRAQPRRRRRVHRGEGAQHAGAVTLTGL